jgi:hypothetical protein
MNHLKASKILFQYKFKASNEYKFNKSNNHSTKYNEDDKLI